MPFRSTPRSALLLGPTLRTTNFLFSLPHFPRVRSPSCFPNPTECLLPRYLLRSFVPYHFPIHIDFFDSCYLFSNSAMSSRVSLTCIPAEEFLSFSSTLSVILFKFSIIKLRRNISFIYLTYLRSLRSLLLSLLSLSVSQSSRGNRVQTE